MLKARAHPTEEIIKVYKNINLVLDEYGLEKLYITPSIWISILEGIDKPVPETIIETSNAILRVDSAIIDQLQVDKSFKQLSDIHL